jgi:hypothetical protein
VVALGTHAGPIPEGDPQDVLRQRADQPGPLGQLDELHGRDEAVAGMEPPRQRLDPDDRSIDQRGLGLVLNRQSPDLDASLAPGQARRH